MTHENIIWIMKRYNHHNPHEPMTTYAISMKIGQGMNWTRGELNKMAKKGLVNKIKEPGKSLFWSAV
jgi:Mn-dependent DtxR family transcriptional regulator